MAQTVHDPFYIDDGLTGTNTVAEAMGLQNQLQDLLAHGGLVLHRSNTSEPDVLRHIPPELMTQ